MIFGNWRPGGLAAGAGLFGYTDALQLRGGGAVHALLLLTAILLVALRPSGCSTSGTRSAACIVARRSPAGVFFWYATTDRRRAAGRLRDAVRRHAARALAGLQRLRMPAADGKPYLKGEEH